MANAKNTIQNIPLTGPLCLNKLKTDVTQFEGYNEKNTTVFGGELTPLWGNKEEIESTDFSYTVYNSKGHKFTIGPNVESGQGGMHLYGPDGEITDPLDDGYLVPFTTELDLPLDAVWGGMFVRNAFDVVEVYLSEDLKLYQRGVQANDWGESTYVLNDFQNEINKQPWTLLSEIDYLNYTLVDAKVAGGYASDIGTGKLVLYLDLLLSRYDHFINVFQYHVFNNSGYGPNAFQEDTNKAYFITTHQQMELTENPNFIMSIDEQDANNRTIYITYTGNSDNGRSDSTVPVKTEVIKFDLDGWHHYETEHEYDFNVMNIAPIDSGVFFNGLQTTLDRAQNRLTTYSCSPYSLRQLSFPDMNKTGSAIVNVSTSVFADVTGTTGHDGDGYLPNLAESDTPSLCSFNFICRDSFLTALTFGGVHITAPTSFSNNYVTISKPFDIGHGICVNYKSGNNWYCFMALSASAIRLFSKYGNANVDLYGGSDLMKNLVIDNRYILMLNRFTEKTFIYDIEEEGILYDGRSLGYVDTKIPIAHSSYTETTGAIWGGGFNAGFEQNNARFVGYMENPYVIEYFPKTDFSWLASGYDTRAKYIQSYFSMGDNVQSAAYVGSDPTYFGTFYPIDPNGNSILPYTLNSRIITGYSNNDMIRINSMAYPLMYYNTNQKIYAYQMLSSMEGVEGIFSLQGQQYTFDDNNIYNVTFQNGIISNAQPICYKKNLTFLGTLPTAAIFYSFYNKTFYQFTGDVIVSKMFEANDINEIYSVAQNPSTLSLWICTDQGVYVMSDTDMFKLNYVSREPVFFQPESTYVIEDLYAHRIAFYKQNDEAIETPIKLATKYYGIGAETKANYDCWYIRLHSKDHKNGKLKLKVNTITNTSFETEEKVFEINKNMYDANDQIYIRYQPKYQTAVAMQLELESDIAIYQISLGVNATDAVAQQSKFNF